MVLPAHMYRLHFTGLSISESARGQRAKDNDLLNINKVCAVFRTSLPSFMNTFRFLST
jgi:hypothetical protein